MEQQLDFYLFRFVLPPPILQDDLDEESPAPAPTLTSAAVKARKISDGTRKTYKDRMGHLLKFLVDAGYSDTVPGSVSVHPVRESVVSVPVHKNTVCDRKPAL